MGADEQPDWVARCSRRPSACSAASKSARRRSRSSTEAPAAAVQAPVLHAVAEAIQTGQVGTYVFVVKADRTAEIRPVTVARNWRELALVAKGVAPGETVGVVPGNGVPVGAGVPAGGTMTPPPGTNTGAAAEAPTAYDTVAHVPVFVQFIEIQPMFSPHA